MMVFENDPFEPTYQAFRELYPDKDAICYWVYEIKDDDGNSVHGLTNFADTDGENEIPIVYVDCNQTINEAGDVLCHELAHVAVGFGHDHDEVWESAYNAIYRRYGGNHGNRAAEGGSRCQQMSPCRNGAIIALTRNTARYATHRFRGDVRGRRL